MIACPVTGSTATEPLCEQGAFRWLRFPESGFVRLADMPDMEAAEAIQDDATGAAYIAGYERKWESKRKRSRRRARYLKSKMNGPRLLDVGSNVGLFVEAASDLGLDAEGLEISAPLVAYARERFPDLTFHVSPLERFGPTGRYHGVYCSEVIEHVPDPADFAARLLALLEPGGALYMTTPSIDEYTKGDEVVRDLGAPDHKLYFSRANIGPFLTRIGFSHVGHRLAFGGGIQVIARA